jgi:hypothetical protein
VLAESLSFDDFSEAVATGDELPAIPYAFTVG